MLNLIPVYQFEALVKSRFLEGTPATEKVIWDLLSMTRHGDCCLILLSMRVHHNNDI